MSPPRHEPCEDVQDAQDTILELRDAVFGGPDGIGLQARVSVLETAESKREKASMQAREDSDRKTRNRQWAIGIAFTVVTVIATVVNLLKAWER